MDSQGILLITALRSAVTGETITIPEPSCWEETLKLARSHKVTALLYIGLKKVNCLSKSPQLMQNVLLQEYRKTVFLSVQLEQCCERISETLNKVQIEHAFLKGTLVKNCYPNPELRTMSDIDILVRSEDRDRLIGAFVAMGAVQENGDGNHYNFRFPEGISVECHPNLIHPTAPFGTELNPGWQYCRRGEDGLWEMTADGMYLHTLCHLAEHFLSGGVGVRFVLDLWLLRKEKGAELDFSLLDSELQRMQLKEFSDNIVALGDMWFGGKDASKDLSELEDYILSSGSHGYAERAVLNEVSLSGKGRTVLKRVLYSREELENRYPWSAKSVLLLPVAWCVRAFQVVTKRRYIINKWLKNAKPVSQEQIDDQRELLSRFGLKLKT